MLSNLLVIGLFFSFFVKFVDLILEVNFCRFSFLCFIFRIFNCNMSTNVVKKRKRETEKKIKKAGDE